MKILSLDQATNMGYCMGGQVGKSVIKYGTITSDKKDFIETFVNHVEFVDNLMATESPALITIEDTQYQKNANIFKKLNWLQGGLITLFERKNQLYHIIKPTEWYSYHNIKGKDKKKQALALARKLMSDESITSDTADAILMWLYAKNVLEPKIVTKN